MSVTLREGAFAKINLTLDVLGKRPDGYHDIQSVMQTISIRDDVEVEVGTAKPWTLSCDKEDVPQDSSNLAWKAAEMFCRAAKRDPEGVAIRITKRIPTQAGLGGGSADAFGRSGDDGCFPLQFHGSLIVCCCIRKVFSLYAFGYP